MIKWRDHFKILARIKARQNITYNGHIIIGLTIKDVLYAKKKYKR